MIQRMKCELGNMKNGLYSSEQLSIYHLPSSIFQRLKGVL